MAIPLSHLDPSLNRFANKLEKKPKDWVLLAGTQAEAIILNRIFNKNKTMSGQSFGLYKTKAWKIKRKDKGRQTGHKDLQMTNQLRTSIKKVTRKDKVTIEFVGQGTYTSGKKKPKTRTVDFIDIADGQEHQIGRGSIFEFSKTELQEVFSHVKKEAAKDIRKIEKESFK